MIKLTRVIAKNWLADVPDDKRFWCQDGQVMKNLAELEAAIKEESLLSGKELEQVIKVVEGRRKKCQRSAWRLACKIYAETPVAFLKRMGVYWKQVMNN